ncbi:MAG: hypothetical protein ACJ75Q_02645 [Gaiellaceae bacterium]
MTLSDTRAARNEALFREVNEEVARLEQRLDGPRPLFVCECAAESCVERVQVPMDAYEEIRSHPRRFVLRPGHEQEAVESVVGSADGYVVVEKTAVAGLVAEQTDPRG